MRRVISVYLPTWPTDRLHRSKGAKLPADEPVVTSVHDGRRQVVGAANAAAASVGLQAGIPLAHAQSLIPDLHIEPADLEGDAASLADLAAWCLRFSPFTAPEGADGIWIDATGCAHLFGGENALLTTIVGKLVASGVAARAAIADTPGAAWAVCRYASTPISVVAEGDALEAMLPLPIAALRLPPEIQASLGRLGFDRIEQLAAAPRGPLALRFGSMLMTRLDQATGRLFEPLEPVFPPDIVAERLPFIEPLSTADAFIGVIAKLTQNVCEELERRSLGARQLDLVFERLDGTHQVIRIGAARPARDPRHLARMFDERIDQVDPGPGVDAMQLVVTLADRLTYTQSPTSLLADRESDPDIAMLVDRLVNRLGAEKVYRVEPTESDVPERSVRRVSPLSKPGKARWPAGLPRPSRLLTPPQAVDAIAEMPDRPPRMFIWRRVRHRIRRADGPERIVGEWWRRDSERLASRDYWQVEDENGRRFWLYRSGDGVDASTGDLRWFLHGFF
jgi:protein ImuB